MPNTCKLKSGSTQLRVPSRGRFYLKPRHCPRTLSPTRRPPRPRRSTKTSRRRPYSSATAPSSSLPNTCKQESGSTQIGVPTRGDFTTNLATAFGVSLLPVADPRPRFSTETSRHRPYSSATALSSLLPNNCKLKSGSTQLGMPTRGRFHNKPRHCPLDSLSYPSFTHAAAAL